MAGGWPHTSCGFHSGIITTRGAPHKPFLLVWDNGKDALPVWIDSSRRRPAIVVSPLTSSPAPSAVVSPLRGSAVLITFNPALTGWAKSLALCARDSARCAGSFVGLHAVRQYHTLGADRGRSRTQEIVGGMLARDFNRRLKPTWLIDRSPSIRLRSMLGYIQTPFGLGMKVPSTADR